MGRLSDNMDATQQKTNGQAAQVHISNGKAAQQRASMQIKP